jgi:arginase family enzyme
LRAPHVSGISSFLPLTFADSYLSVDSIAWARTCPLVRASAAYAPRPGDVVFVGLPTPDLRLPTGSLNAAVLVRQGMTALPLGCGGVAAPIRDGGAADRPVLDLGDLASEVASLHEIGCPPPLPIGVERCAAELFDAGARPIFAAGDHALTDQILRGLYRARRHERIALVVLDAKLEVQNHGTSDAGWRVTPFARSLEAGICTGSSTAVIGLRPHDTSRLLADWLREGGSHLLLVEDVLRGGPGLAARSVLDAVLAAADVLYLSVDLEVATPARAQQTGRPCGLPPEAVLELVANLAASPALVGADIVGASSRQHATAGTAQLAARIFLEIASNLSGS